ncbi:hypothetical protein HWI79_14 [Cryptosporidium felis]|nr:hypothetical protein HWI79_14 [Cryptosporidium felis]
MGKLETFLRTNLVFLAFTSLIIVRQANSQVYGSAKDVLNQLNSRYHPHFADLTNHPYYLPEKAVFGYDSLSLKENIYSSVPNNYKREIDNDHYKELHRRKSEFSELEKERRRNQDAYKEFIKLTKHGKKGDNMNKKTVKRMLEYEKKFSNNTDISHELVRKMESPIEAEKLGLNSVFEESGYISGHQSWPVVLRNKSQLFTEEIYTKTRVDPTLNVAFDSSSYNRLPQEYGDDRECVATYKDPVTRKRICIEEGEYFDNLKKGPNRNGYLVWHPERSKHSVEMDVFSEEYFRI